MCDKEEGDTTACGYRCHNNSHVYPDQDNKVLNPWRAPFSRAGESDLLQTCRSHNIVPWRAPCSRAGEIKKKVDRMSDTHECFSVCFNHGDNSGFIQLIRATSFDAATCGCRCSPLPFRSLFRMAFSSVLQGEEWKGPNCVIIHAHLGINSIAKCTHAVQKTADNKGRCTAACGCCVRDRGKTEQFGTKAR